MTTPSCYFGTINLYLGFSASTEAQEKAMAQKICHTIEGLAFPISLIQTGKDRFTVVYGKQTKKRLSYAQAAEEYGAAIMHALACDGKLDNREQGER